MKRLILIIALAPCRLWAQTPNFGGEEKTRSLTYRGVTANAQTDPANHTRNRHPTNPRWGGCVPSSVRTAALYAGIPADEIEKFWEIAQREVGTNGTHPQMLENMVRRAFPNRKWVSYVGTNPDEVERVYNQLSSQGFLVNSTMGWGELYGQQIIAHMVSDPHFSTKDGYACVEDNNDEPGVYRWMPAKERLARAMSGGQAWLFAFVEGRSKSTLAAIAVILACACVVTVIVIASAATAAWTILFT